MRGVLQRVSEASVSVNGELKHAIGRGIVLLLSVEEEDSDEDLEWLCGKLIRMRIFPDAAGKMDLDLNDVDGELLLISQFTLHASTKKGNRPSFIRAARPEQAISYYEKALSYFNERMPSRVGSGVFGADMKVHLVNDGPVTISLDSKNKE